MADVAELAAKAGAEAVTEMGPAAAMAGGKRSKWMAHVKKTMRSHKGKSLKQVLKLAAKSYKSKGGSGPLYLSPQSVSSETGSLVGGRRRRSSKKTRRSRRH